MPRERKPLNVVSSVVSSTVVPFVEDKRETITGRRDSIGEALTMQFCSRSVSKGKYVFIRGRKNDRDSVFLNAYKILWSAWGLLSVDRGIGWLLAKRRGKYLVRSLPKLLTALAGALGVGSSSAKFHLRTWQFFTGCEGQYISYK